VHSLPFSKPGRFWRGNIHMHSTSSDGKLTPGEIISAYCAQGYDFVALTDHFMAKFGWPVVDTSAYRGESFTTLFGAELHAGETSVGEPWHLVAVGLPLDFGPVGKTETPAELAQRAAGAGAFVGIAHPNRYALTLEEALTIEAADAIEVFNHTTVTHNDRADSWWMCDQMNSRGRRVLAFGADDAHFTTRPDGFGCWVQVKSARLDPNLLVEALKAGEFYTTQGPELIDVSVKAGRIQVACSPAVAIFASGRGSIARQTRGVDLTHTSFAADAFRGAYFRITIVDAEGRRAWTNPVWPT
jgi:hypothetical protein